MPERPEKSTIEIRHVSKVFGSGENAVIALDDVSLDIRENEFFTLLGPSGCGKTTLLRLIAGFSYPTEGEIKLYGQDIAPLPPYKRPVNTVFQSYALFPHMSVGENIAFGLEMLGRPKSAIRTRVEEMLALVRMEHLRDRKTAQISGGQQQRVALARALAPQPKVLLLDEPLSALDYKLRKDMQIELKRLQHETGITFIFVTHDQEEALTMSDRLAVMSSGRILQIGNPRQIYDRPAERFVADFIGETNFLTAEVTGLANGKAEVALPGGAKIHALLTEDRELNGAVSVVVRPEHAEIVSNANGADLKGRLANIVYFGTDTLYHVVLETGETFIVRRQNSRKSVDEFSEGTAVGIILADGSAQILRD
ncbi:ABC transporter ATP-binding protein [Mesorhizobium xinjiangense]|uniref:ABC transporter ATP-binding protein n=1 Tax=Mesorhizobium xinjiangense TaxID=2678685 RepID=UPI0012ED6AFA|nr:ABC transporter ATP-binding protein [Mesorhizobium xinjiangense]